ncbi:hypothetical protein FRC19_008284 [Serendipita sp. 401]|nr:hypothetical protein FRC19_008284 [Serendipita sp. 401]
MVCLWGCTISRARSTTLDLDGRRGASTRFGDIKPVIALPRQNDSVHLSLSFLPFLLFSFSLLLFFCSGLHSFPAERSLYSHSILTAMSSISVSQIISILRTMVVPRMPIALEAFLSLIFRIHTRRTIQPSPQPLLAQPSLGIETHPNSDQQQQQQQQQQEEEEHDSPPPLNLVPRDEIPSSPICTIQDRLTAAENEIAELRRYIASVEQLLHDHLANYCHQVHIETGAETGPSAPIVIPLRGSPERDPIPIDNRMTFDMDSDFGRIHPEPNSPNPFVSTASPARDWMRFIAERVQPPPRLSQAQPTIGENMLGLELFNPPDLEPLSPVDGDSDQLIPRGRSSLSGNWGPKDRKLSVLTTVFMQPWMDPHRPQLLCLMVTTTCLTTILYWKKNPQLPSTEPKE